MKKKLLITLLSVLMLVACAIGFAACGQVEFKLSFIVDGEVYASIDTSGDEVITMPDDPEKEDYIFDGWYWDEDTWQRPFTANSLLNEPISSDMSVYAKWLEEDITKRSYTVSFNSFGGSAVSDVTVQYGKLLTEPSEPARTGYVFVGWYKDADLKTEWDFAFDTVTEDITLYAKWVDESDATGCDILSADGFEVDGNTLSVKVPNAQEHFALSEAITVSPYAEWTVTSDITGNAEIPSATVPLAVGDNTYYINVVSGNGSNKKQYTVEIRRRDIYTVTYSFSNGSADVTEQVEEDGKAPFKSAVKTGYTFDCWKNDSSAWDFENDVISGDTTLTASWTANTYDVTFDSNGGDTITASTATYDVAFEFTVPVRNGYTFSGWKTEGGTKLTDSTGKSIGVWNIAADTTLYADWSATEYSVVYNNMDGATNSNPAKYTVEDDTITLANAEKTGYTFLGWYSDSSMTSEVKQIDTSAAVNVELWAKWEVIEYTATFRNSDGVVDTVKFTVEDKTITEPKVPERNGYTGAWETYELTADDLTINAVYTPVTYTITYTNTKDAENVNATQFTVESETIKLADLSVNGYTFNGWYNGDEKVTEITTGTYGNIALEARWTPVVYTITYEYDDTVGNLPDGVTLKTSYTIEDAFDFASLNCNSVGYNFAGWFTEKELGTGEQVTGIALGTTGNKTYYAQWGLETYSITFENVEGAVNTNPDTYTIESATFTLSNVSKTGYLFEGWYTDAQFSSPAQTTIELGSHGDRTFYAKWSLVSYSITYNLYGGSYEGAENPASYDIETEVKLVAPVLEGSFFAGWYTLSEGGALTTEIPEGTTGNITLYARWITFESNGGSKVEYDLQYSEDGITPPAAPEKDYYVFAGWYLDAQFETAYDFNTLPQSTCTLYAKWTPVEYTINYVLNGGTNNDSNPATYTVEDAVTFAAPSKTGYTFNGWYSNAQFTGVLVEGITLGSHGEITLYASFSVNEYTITFNANGGTTVAAITQNYGTEVTAPASPSKTGYRFAGWYADAELKTPYAFTTIPAEDITVYAKWTIVEYEIVYNLDGGTNNESNPATYTVEDAVTFAAPSKLGYEFAGWFSDADYKNAITSLSIGSYGDIEVFAKWNIIEYSIEYVTADGAVNENPLTYTVETDVTELLDAVLKGHTFNGWYSGENCTQAVTTFGGGSVGDITLYAKFTANTYDVWMDGSEAASATVTFDLNGASGTAPAAQTVTETDTLVYPEVPERSGYIFGGWYANKDCEGELYDFSGLVGGDITLYAKWVKTGSADGGININDSVTFDLKGTAEQKYIFIPLVSGNVSITTTGSIDTLGTLYKDGVLLKQDDDSAADGKNFLIVYNVTAGEVYEIRVRGFSTNTDGSVILSIAGTYKVADGGYAQAGNKVTVTYGSHFTLPVPEGGELQKFLGWQDENGVMYTDETGASIRVWDKDGAATLFSKWERMEYTITFVTSGGSEIASVTLEYGARVDINEYVTTRSGYTFAGWYLDGAEYNATTMPGYNITLTARWVTFSLGSIKYDTDKKAVSVNDEITADLFGAICIDTDGKSATFTVSVNGAQEAGNTITVRITASSGNKTAVVTITDVKVYGTPTVTVENTDKNYINPDEFTAEAWGASGTDTFGAETQIVVRLGDGKGPGDVTTVYIDSIDVAGNITTYEIENVSVYGLPVITYDTNKTNISVNDTLDASLFGASAVDSFGSPVDVTVSLCSGTIIDGNKVTIRLFTTDEKGNITNIDLVCNVYGTPIISDALITDIKTTDTICPNHLGITGKDTYGNSLDVTLAVKEGVQVAGTTMTVTATVVDIAGNIATRDFTIKVYGAPKISYDRVGIKVSENPEEDASVLNVTARDSFGNSLFVTAKFKSGTHKKGSFVVYTLTATDHLGNSYSVDTIPIGVYDITDIENSFTYNEYMSDLAKISSNGGEFDSKATDSFGNDCVITIESADGSTLVGGQTTSIVIVATDKAGNRVVSDVIEGIKIYDKPTAELLQDKYIISADTDVTFLFKVLDSFGNEIFADITALDEIIAGEVIRVQINATDDAGNELSMIVEFAVEPTPLYYVELYNDGSLYKHLFLEDFVSYMLPVPPDDNNIFMGWVDANGELYTDEYGVAVKNLSAENKLYAKWYYELIYTADDLEKITGDKNYLLLNDIDITDRTIPSINIASGALFNGNGHIITINQASSSWSNSGALFNKNEGSIINLGIVGQITITITDSTGWTSSSEDKRTEYYGGFISNNNGIIKNCYTDISLTVDIQQHHGKLNYYGGATAKSTLTSYTGGFVGYNKGEISNCYAKGSILVTAKSSASAYASPFKVSSSTKYNVYAYSYAYTYVGGFVGYNDGNIEYAYSDTVISGKSNCSSTAQYITGCTGAQSANTNSQCFVGLFAGVNNTNGSISSSFAVGNMTSTATSDGKTKIGNTVSTTGVKTTNKAQNYSFYCNNSGSFAQCYFNTNCSSYVVNTNKTEETNLQSEEWLTETLGWDTSCWEFTNGQLPGLKTTKISS